MLETRPHDPIGTCDDHEKAANRLLDQTNAPNPLAYQQTLIAAAQVHAVLALAAAVKGLTRPQDDGLRLVLNIHCGDTTPHGHHFYMRRDLREGANCPGQPKGSDA
ncbi:hypothetical protein SAMN06264364_1499 [Quadrisphaera granulorum]|uniref:Uncharacterized protein n=1 Tax=Quadrisphaera granulorum TaxID=317664 RepID=A0A315ZM73_9ACTN|nr:hypothetical protein [Quadrisphaera granulorum]PWJ46273.1 hypothetical protein BXY45_1499 [Quadrisphaera granulorum]SZE99088.1 hypothetical protein SAMN06264364_1499 [Quadrisphaera granulorum]